MSEPTTPFALHRLGIVMQPDPLLADDVEGVLNPGAARGPDGELYLFPRVVAHGDYSRIGIARVLFGRRGDPTGVERLGYALEPREAYEHGSDDSQAGCEDARVVYVEPLEQYVMTYVTRGADGSRIALAVSDDLFDWQRLGPVHFEPSPDPAYGVDFNAYRNKDSAFFSRTVAGPDGRPALALLHRPIYDDRPVPRGADPRPGIWISYCALDDARRDLHNLTRLYGQRELATPRYGWEELWIGGGAAPILTALGWLVIYHGVKKRPPKKPHERKPVVYSAGALVLDVHDPRTVLYRSPEPILRPETAAETGGEVPDTVFPSGVDDRGDGRIDVYYGLADTRIGAARLRLPDALPRPPG